MLDVGYESAIVNESHNMLISQQFENKEASALYHTSALLVLSWNSAGHARVQALVSIIVASTSPVQQYKPKAFLC